MILAVTGATGFVGRRVLLESVSGQHKVRALTRRSQLPRPGVEWIEGALGDHAALQRLVEGANAVLHIAGVVNAPDAAGFEAGNVAGTRSVVEAAQAAGLPRFIHVSSLAARQPELSLYGASKARSERLVEESGLDWVIVRPPAVYGPGDREMLDLFKAASAGVVPLPPAGRLSLIHADDLARLLLALATANAPSQTILEPDGGQEGGYTHKEFAQAIGAALERNPLLLPLPAAVLKTAARIDRLVRRSAAKLTPDRAAYFCHPDWVADPGKRPPRDLWEPRISLADGLQQTADWYCERGWL